MKLFVKLQLVNIEATQQPAQMLFVKTDNTATVFAWQLNFFFSRRLYYKQKPLLSQ